MSYDIRAVGQDFGQACLHTQGHLKYIFIYAHAVEVNVFDRNVIGLNDWSAFQPYWGTFTQVGWTGHLFPDHHR